MRRKSKESASHRGKNASSAPRGKRAPTIIVPLDGTSHATVALPVAKVMAELEGAALRIVHVAEPTLPPQDVLHRLGLTAEQLRGFVVDEVAGTPAKGIIRVAQEWDSLMIVMCTHTGMMEPRLELGPVAEEVLRLSPCPVALVRPERGLHPWKLRRILLPHDGTPTTAIAIGPAADLAGKAQAELVVVHVANLGAGRRVEPGTFAGPRYLDQPHHEWPAWADEFIGRLCALGHAPSKMKLRLFLAKGEAGAEIVRFAEENDVDLIVLGWHGRLGAERAATMRSVLGNAPCPVLVTRVPTE